MIFVGIDALIGQGHTPQVHDQLLLLAVAVPRVNHFSKSIEVVGFLAGVFREFDKVVNRGAVDLQSLTQLCLLYTSPSPRDKRQSRMPSSA